MELAKLPGFSAEQALGKPKRRYRGVPGNATGNDGAVPQLLMPACGGSAGCGCGGGDSYADEDDDVDLMDEEEDL